MGNYWQIKTLGFFFFFKESISMIMCKCVCVCNVYTITNLQKQPQYDNKII